MIGVERIEIEQSDQYFGEQQKIIEIKTKHTQLDKYV